MILFVAEKRLDLTMKNLIFVILLFLVAINSNASSPYLSIDRHGIGLIDNQDLPDEIKSFDVSYPSNSTAVELVDVSYTSNSTAVGFNFYVKLNYHLYKDYAIIKQTALESTQIKRNRLVMSFKNWGHRTTNVKHLTSHDKNCNFVGGGSGGLSYTQDLHS